MKIRKISASYIFDGVSGFLKNSILVLFEDGRVIKLIDTGGKLSEEANLEHYNGILCPGFVNAHCHLELSHMLGKIPRNTELTGFIERVVTSRKAEPEIILRAISEADREMARQGIVAVGDICNTSDSFEIKADSTIYYHSFVEVFGTSVHSAPKIYNNGKQLVRTAKEKFKLKAVITPHSSYSLGEELFRLIREGMRADELILSIHNQEISSENELISEGSGQLFDTLLRLGFDMTTKTPQKMNALPWLIKQLPRDKRFLLVHNLYTTDRDISDAGIENADVYWVLCPKSNFYIGGVYPGPFLFERFPERVCIGTDSLASNDKLSIVEELYALQEAQSEIKLETLLFSSTINGAKALGISDWCGSFEPGKKPGVLLIENTDILNLKLKNESKIKVLN